VLQTALNLYRSGKSNAAIAHFRYFIKPTSDVIIGDHLLLQPLTVLDDAERLFITSICNRLLIGVTSSGVPTIHPRNEDLECQ
jgi:hypothetical protein